MAKLLYILRSMAMLAGTERVVSDKINWLADHGYEVTLVTYEQGSHPLAFSLHPEVKVIDLDVRFFTIQHLPLYRRYIEYLRMRATFRKRLKRVVDDFCPDVILTTAYSLKVAGEIVKVRRKARLVIESHETCFSVVKEYDYKSRPLMRQVAKYYDRQYYSRINCFDRLVTLTEGDANEWRKHVTSAIEVIPNPLTFYPSALEEKPLQPYFRIISAGRLERVKGFDYLINAYALIAEKHLEWHVDIFGDGSCKDELQALIARHGLEHCITIQPPTTQIYDEYQRSDFYVLSSRHEGLGMVILEAMSCGIPCVAFNCKYGPGEIITDGENGLLAEDRDIHSLANAMEAMMENRKEQLRMGKNARETVMKYQKDAIMQRWVELFKSL